MSGHAGTFLTIDTDGARRPAGLDGVYAGPVPTAAWLVCGGPSLTAGDAAVIDRSPAAVMTVNLAGHGLLRPDFWTSYDPTCRFLKSLYLDGSVTKFLHARRATDLVPETTYKVCESPGAYFFERDVGRRFGSLLSPSSTKVVDWADSMVQATDILSRLGFRTIYLAGADLHVRPSETQVERASSRGVEYVPRQPLDDFARACAAAGLSEADLTAMGEPAIYHFEERKPWGAAVQTDRHYFRVVQWLRQSRRNLAAHGLRLVSVTAGGRLNDHFPSMSVAEADREIKSVVGDPGRETTTGLYHRAGPRLPPGCGPMRDIPPLNVSPPRPIERDADLPEKPPERAAERFDAAAVAAALPDEADAVPVEEG